MNIEMKPRTSYRLEMPDWWERRVQMRAMLERQKLDALHAGDEPTAQQCIVELHQLENNE